jgi:hypothetical protein
MMKAPVYCFFAASQNLAMLAFLKLASLHKIDASIAASVFGYLHLNSTKIDVVILLY